MQEETANAPQPDAVDATPTDLGDLRNQALGIVQKALDEGSIDVALGVLALQSPPRTRRTGWILATVGALALLALLGGLLAYQSLEGGTSGSAAPAPMSLGALSAISPTTTSAAGTTSADGGATGTSVPTDVLGVSLTAPTVPAAKAATAAPSSPGAASAPAARLATPGAAVTGPTAAAAPTTARPRVGALDGSWNAGPGAMAGYRVSKTWTLTGSSEIVVGRTPRVAGSLAIAGDVLTNATVVADMGSMDSGEALRDYTFRTSILNTAAYPEARFTLTSPIDISGRPAAGTTMAIRANGKLTAHGITRDVTADIQARQNGAAIEVVGSIAVSFADFGIGTIDIGVARVDDHGTLEFQVSFAKV